MCSSDLDMRRGARGSGRSPRAGPGSAVGAARHGALERGEEWTEDATLVAHAGHPVHVLPGTDRNLKVTTPTDVRLAEFLLREEERDV